MRARKRLAVLASGEGTTFKAILEACQKGSLPADIAGLVVSRESAGALQHARSANIHCEVLDPRKFSSRDEWDRRLTETLTSWRPDWVVLAGFTHLLGPRFLKEFEGRAVNTHPSLLPKHGGQGMYGLKVHQSVLDANESESGITVHFVTGEYDSGPVIAQKKVMVEKEDTAESLAARIKGVEKEFYLSVLGALLEK